MAYFQDDEDEIQQDPNQPNGAQTTGTGSSVIGTNATPATAPGAGEQAAGSSASAGGSGSGGVRSPFVGINDYINANKSQSGKLANQVGGYVEGLGNDARNQLSTQEAAYNQDVDNNTVNYNSGLFNEVNQNAAQVAADQAKKDQVTAQRTAEYKGPTSFETSNYYQPVNTAIKSATTAADNTNTQAGRDAILSQFQNTNNGRANSGILALDNALLSSDPTAKTRLEQARAANSDLQGLFDTTASNATTKAQQAAATTQATNQQANQALTSNFQALKDLVAGKVTSAKENYTSAEDVRAGSLTDKQLQNLGLSRADYNRILADQYVDQGNLSNYVGAKTSGNMINANNVASAEDYAREQALIDLMGSDEDFINTPDEAGTGNLQSSPFNLNKLKQDQVASAAQRLAMFEATSPYGHALILGRQKTPAQLAWDAQRNQYIADLESYQAWNGKNGWKYGRDPI